MEWTCGICQEENHSYRCTKCGFDISRDYTKYASLCPLPEADRHPQEAVLKAEREKKKAEEEKRKAEERKREEEKRKAEERKREEEKRKAEERKRAEEEKRKAAAARKTEEILRRADGGDIECQKEAAHFYLEKIDVDWRLFLDDRNTGENLDFYFSYLKKAAFAGDMEAQQELSKAYGTYADSYDGDNPYRNGKVVVSSLMPDLMLSYSQKEHNRKMARIWEIRAKTRSDAPIDEEPEIAGISENLEKNPLEIDRPSEYAAWSYVIAVDYNLRKERLQKSWVNEMAQSGENEKIAKAVSNGQDFALPAEVERKMSMSFECSHRMKKWLILAARQGSAEAAYTVAINYYYWNYYDYHRKQIGRVPGMVPGRKEWNTAYYWFHQAELAGYPPAVELLAQIEEEKKNRRGLGRLLGFGQPPRLTLPRNLTSDSLGFQYLANTGDREAKRLSEKY